MAENKGAAPASAPAASYSTDPALYIYTSLTAGSSHIVTATSRLETILRANRVPFKAVDLSTDDKARMLWGRRAGKDESGRARKLPALVQMGLVLGDLVEIEEWNEYGELKQHVTIYYDDFTIPTKAQAPPLLGPKKQPVKPAAASSTTKTTAATTAKPAPAAPPLPTEKDKSKIPLSSPASEDANKNKSSGGVVGAAANAAASAAQPIRSIAEEAAAKAKAVHLQSLRDKVYGKGGKDEEGKEQEQEQEAKAKDTSEATPSTPAPKDQTTTSSDSLAGGVAGLNIDPAGEAAGKAGLQSPTTGTWRGGVPADDAIAPMLQSPTSGTWKTESGGGPTVRQHRGSSVTAASHEEIAAVEKETTIPEEAGVSSGEEDSSSEEEEEEEEEGGKKEDKSKK
ncbi:hypothetical protein F5Y15DRAFT_362037 [Xylariaceae sp. FL0016]|nr:hypothetical protein F5Y15DRAFT_362037 [Xylariaceae sp. FL0016]